jgi:hypothetical protein
LCPNGRCYQYGLFKDKLSFRNIALAYSETYFKKPSIKHESQSFTPQHCVLNSSIIRTDYTFCFWILFNLNLPCLFALCLCYITIWEPQSKNTWHSISTCSTIHSLCHLFDKLGWNKVAVKMYNATNHNYSLIKTGMGVRVCWLAQCPWFA